jgi:hypothetical protein
VVKLNSAVVGCGLLLAMMSTPHAAPISYDIIFEVEYYNQQGTPVDPRVELGDIYKGSFTVDDAILSQDGLNKAGIVSAFNITMEDVSWTMGLGYPYSVFSGFRGPGGLGADSPGFDVFGGSITNLRGGVFGSSDIPFVDFSYDFRAGAPPFPDCATGAPYCGNAPNMFWTVSVPEPETYVMVLLGLGVVGFVNRRLCDRNGTSRRAS